MTDIWMLLLIVGSFALLIGYVAGCDRLQAVFAKGPEA